jgi:glycosyltransferase involved in cell wall biosynthesis
MSDGRVEDRIHVLTMVDGLYGGAEELAWQIACRLDSSRFSSMVCVTRWTPSRADDEVVARLRTAGIDFIGMDRGSRYDLRPWRTLVREMRGWRVDILHTHKFGSNLWGALVSRWAPVPVFIAHEHTWSWEGQRGRKLLDRHLIARRASAVVAVSEADRHRMTSVEGIPSEKTRYISNGIPERDRSRTPHNVRLELNLRPDQPVVGMVANLRPQKAYDVLIRAAGLLHGAVPDLRVLIVGSDDDRGTQTPQLKALVDELALGDVVSFLGRRQDVFDVIDSFDVAVLSSDYEGSPLALLEYMEAAKPVVATNVGGVPDLVVDGQTGLLVEPRDPESLSAAILSLLRSPERTRIMGNAGRERRMREFSIDNTTRKVEELYEELCAREIGGRERTRSTGP